jgi:hypothetical protein
MALETRGIEAERLAVAGQHEAALALAEAELAKASRIGGQPGLVAGLERVVALALGQRGDAGGAERHLRNSLAVAAGGGAAFEAALAHRGLAAILRRRGEDPAAHERAAEQIARMLKVKRFPELPVG